MPRRRSSTTSSAPRRRTRRSTSSPTSRPSERRSLAARRARPSKSPPRAVPSSSRSWTSKPREPLGSRGLFERFTERARQVVVLAQDEARGLKHNYIGTEHILLGLLREEQGIAARVLEGFDVTVEKVRAQVRQIIGEGDEPAAGQIPFTPRAKKVLELAL